MEKITDMKVFQTILVSADGKEWIVNNQGVIVSK